MINDILDRVRHYLPAQGPIKDFIHHNTLHAFQEYPFEKAVNFASELYGTHAYMPQSFYLRAQAEGRIDEKELQAAIDRFSKKASSSVEPHFVKIRNAWRDQMDLDWDAAINPVVFRVVSGFLDQGITLWHFPTREIPFFEAIKTLITQSSLPLGPFIRKKRCIAWFEMKPEAVVSEILSLMLSDERLYEPYILETLLAHGGWSGMVNVIETRPSCLLRPRQITLMEFLAFKLILEWEFIQSYCPDFQRLTSIINPPTPFSKGRQNAGEKQELPVAVWHEAFERTAYHKILSAIKIHSETKKTGAVSNPSVQAVFCIDDRECSFRRHLEEIDPSVETFGWAGFFGLDFFFQSLNDAAPVQMCPPIVTPKYVVKEVPKVGHESEFLRQKAQTQKTALSLELWREATSSLFLGFLAANTLGQLTVFRLVLSLFRPQRLLKSLKSRRIDIPTQLTVLRGHEEDAVDDRFHGFTHDEMAVRVENVLRGMGLTKDFAPLVVLLAHGSSSVNNPHFAAYDCGACSGKPGAPNARVMAHMANVAEVRAALVAKGITIAAHTRFVGGYHDTATDVVTFFDTDMLSEQHRGNLDEFRKSIEAARHRNALERCRRFAVSRLDMSESDAMHEVTKRALALFEPRPELGHATNISCLVGRREFSRGLFLDRRAFLNSYDPLVDPEGKVLTQILSAAIPVCGGINLEYYFSRVDTAKYGCGTKLSHNVCGLLGVCNGIDDDLRTGLPVQMTEVHDPIRLLMVIEQRSDIVERVLTNNPGLMQWVENSWMFLATSDPHTKKISFYSPQKGFEILHNLSDVIPTRASSRACYEGRRENVEIARIEAV